VTTDFLVRLLQFGHGGEAVESVANFIIAAVRAVVKRPAINRAYFSRPDCRETLTTGERRPARETGCQK
jgi:hypothetical protein